MATKKRCEIMTAEECLRKITAPAIADWARRKRKRRTKAVTIDYVALIPKYPTNPDDYVRCMPAWMECWTLATEMNTRRDTILSVQQAIAMVTAWPPSGYRDQYLAYLNGQLATLQTVQAQNVPILSALIGAYEDCMTGTPV